jgi:prevent-host-death family protein
VASKNNEIHQQNRVGIRELRLDTSKILSRVVEGEEFLVTDRGEPIAQLIPINKDVDDFFNKLVEAGEIIPAQNPNHRFKAPVITHNDKKSLSEKLIEERGTYL